MKSNQDTSQFEPIDAQRALELLEKAVAERGEEYVYTGVGEDLVCEYVYDGMPSCMVGVALTLHGVPVESLADIGRVSADYLPSHLPGISQPAGNVLRAAQAAQDNGTSWGDALTAARTLAGES